MQIAIKPRQIINYDGIVLIDLHQLNVKTTSDNTNQLSHWNTGQPHVNQGTEPAEQQPATSASNQMIEQINIALQKGPKSQPGSLEACRLRLTLKEESIYIN